MFGFQLGREWKLSIAELINIFPEASIVYSASGILILDKIYKEEILENVNKIGGTIKIFELNLISDIQDFYEKLLFLAENNNGKFKYSCNLFGAKKLKIDNILKKTKYFLKKNNISSRYFNKEDGKNLSSAQIIGNSILRKGFDFNIVDLGEIYYFGKTIWVQDIDSYSKRDFGKKTDMQIGMLPPKLCQIMINIGKTKGEKAQFSHINSLYDPFVGLGTILIEAANMGFSELFGSDLNENMVKIASENLEIFTENKNLLVNYSIIKLNAKFINEAPFFEKNLNLIVTEGYLGEIMTQKNISLDRINKQKESLIKIYESFFENLKNINFSGNIVICFPFWELNGKYIYFNEILNIIEKNNFKKENIFKNKDFDLTTKLGSLLYKRKSQLVGREIFKLSLK